MVRESRHGAYFNTSHVNVNQHTVLILQRVLFHFNTSHVNVNQAELQIYTNEYLHFNTSHVNVNLLIRRKSGNNTILFQYISC